MSQLPKVKQHRLHNEGSTTLMLAGATLLVVAALDYWLLFERSPIAFYTILSVFILAFAIIVNFFRCPMRIFTGETENVVVAPADGKIVVIEEVEENEYFHDRRKMVSVFMSVTNVHANWFPVEGVVKMVRHHNGNFAKAWLPKASVENERSTIVISTPSGHDVLVRQTCKLDNHLGFIKFGSRVDVYLPLDAEIDVVMGQTTTGNTTVLGRLKPKQTQAEA